MKTPPPLDAFSFTLSAIDAESVYALVNRHGFEKTSAGVKDFLLATANKKISVHKEPEPETEIHLEDLDDEPELGEGLRKIFDALKRNPEVMDFAKKKGAGITRSLLHHLFK